MAVKRRKKRASRKRRRNPSASVRIKGTKRRRKYHKIRVYKVGRGKRAKLYRSPRFKLRPRRVNRKRRKNPKFALKSYFGQNRLMNGIALLAGLGGSAFAKTFLINFLPGNIQGIASRGYGAVSIIAGAMLNNRARRKTIKSVGTGMVVFGIYDLLTSNIPALNKFLPTISAPTLQGSMAYGRSVYGSGIQSGPVEIVGANLTAGSPAEIVGDDYDGDLADALEMSM